MKLYGDKQSGNCYKIQLLCANLNIDYQWCDVDILGGDTQSEAFLGKNANGKIPLLEIAPGEYLSESNAILNYLAANSRLLPNARLSKAQVLQWQFFEQYSHEPYIAVARFIKKYLGLPNARKREYLQKQNGGYKALDVMEKHLAQQVFFVDNQYSIADISLFAYTHVAHEGGFDLRPYPKIRAWISRVQQLPGFVAMG
ncbi:glutathione S-transferase family protein [Thalassotalea sp. Y01]|uniref:glutathione S-transferase family protein n=1 Tax=Thalassotalea sp. Y01 TaxID=2729613 RepID=UPI00145CA284|nr:glutathione S-transferase family protein [Thalassotalea sp. Y01]NMP17605.1 glutathione S-transferase family protein [Thalassotalea sp. Y01]